MELASTHCRQSFSALPTSIRQLGFPNLTQFSSSHFQFPWMINVKHSSVFPSTKMVSNGYAGRGSFRYNNSNNDSKIYRRLDSCLVIPPPEGKKPRAILKFLGGAFIGAVPEVTYSHLIELLAKEGFLIVSVPYNVTFDHAQAAKEIYERFNACLDRILTSGLPDANLAPAELIQLPIYSVGHSNGALLQVLVGCYFSEKIPKANAIISYNNRPATEAVPYFEQFGPLVSQMLPVVEASPLYSMATSASGDAWKVLQDTAGAMIREYDQEVLVSLNNFVDQLPSVLNQVTQGISEFKPTPSENRECFKNSYNVQHTLLVKFDFDAIDETDLLEETLKPRVESIGGTLEKVTLSGNHITPCIQEFMSLGDACGLEVLATYKPSYVDEHFFPILVLILQAKPIQQEMELIPDLLFPVSFIMHLENIQIAPLACNILDK